MPDVVQFCRKPAPGAFSIERVDRNMRAALPSDIHVTVHENRFLSRGILSRLRDALRAARLAGPVNHITGDVHYLAFFLPRKRTILTIHDTVLIERALGLKRWLLWLFWLYLPHRRVERIVAISDETRAHIRALLRRSDRPVTVIPNAIDPIFRPAPYPPLEGPFRLLLIGTKANKNLERSMEALAGMPVELTVVGMLSHAQSRLAKSLGFQLRSCAGLSDAELVAEYARCHALLFVSLSEGFGLPVIEAQAVGRPVITSNRAPMKDVAGGAALLVDPEDGTGIRDACLRLLNDPALRAGLIEAGHANAANYSASRCADAYAAIYREVSLGTKR